MHTETKGSECRISRKVICVSFSILLMLSGLAYAQTPAVTIPEGGGADFAPPNNAPQFKGNPFDQPPTFDLIPKSAISPRGKVWVRSNKAGLVIWGRVEAPDDSIRWPQQKADMLAGNHIEIWLATSTSVALPEIGFGNQFGPVLFKTAADCKRDDNSSQPDNDPDIAQCRRWFEQQVFYRTQLKRLFVRQWLVGDTHSFEDFATTAYAPLRASFFDDSLPEILAPKPHDGFRSEVRSTVQHATKNDASGHPHNDSVTTGYEFHIFIPYSAFPPAPELSLSDIWLMVDVFNSAEPGHKMGVFSSTSARREWGASATFNHLRLQNPRSVAITPCGYKLQESDVYGAEYGAWYFPAASDDNPRLIDSDFALINDASGYEYKPGSMSPLVKTFRHFSRKLPDFSTVCGPDLAYVNGRSRGESEFQIDEDHLESRRLADGWLLLRSGPTLTIQNPNFGSGQCGACAVEMMQIYAISPAGQIAKALDLSDRISGSFGDPDDVDYAFSADWSRITYYTDLPDDPNDQSENAKTHTTSVTYCLKDHKYDKCGHSDNAKMPNPPNFKSPEGPQ
jgi:hypothetical protein